MPRLPGWSAYSYQLYGFTMIHNGLRRTCNWTTVWSVDGRRACVAVGGIPNILAVGGNVEFQSSVHDIVGVIGIDPSALGNILAATLFVCEPSG